MLVFSCSSDYKEIEDKLRKELNSKEVLIWDGHNEILKEDYYLIEVNDRKRDREYPERPNDASLLAFAFYKEFIIEKYNQLKPVKVSFISDLNSFGDGKDYYYSTHSLTKFLEATKVTERLLKNINDEQGFVSMNDLDNNHLNGSDLDSIFSPLFNNSHKINAFVYKGFYEAQIEKDDANFSLIMLIELSNRETKKVYKIEFSQRSGKIIGINGC